MKKVFIADDTKNIRLLLTKCLQMEGYDVTCATNGTEACEMILKNEYDLIFLDIKMPELSGTEVLRQMRRAGIETPVIIITAFPTIKNAVDCTQLGAIRYLQKPFTADRLRSVLSEIDLDSIKKADVDNINALILKGDLKTAETKAQSYLGENSELSEAYYLLSKIYEKMGAKDKADKFKAAGRLFEE